MSLKEKMHKLLGNRKFLEEKRLHENNCEDGMVLWINQYYPELSEYKPCQFCLRIKAAKEKKRIEMQERLAKEGQLSVSNEILES